MRDGRNYSFDGRSNVRQITGQTFDGSNWRNYTITNAYDHKNRRVFKSYVQAGLSEAHWFFYYDQDGRLLEVKHTPNIASPSTYSVFQFYWIGRRAIAYWQQSFPSSTISRRYLHSDAENKVLEVWSWPTSGAATAQWRIEPDSFGWDIVLFGWSVYQPLRGAGGGEYVDEETISYNDSIGGLRPPLHTTLQGAYDPLVGQYLQSDDREGVDSYTGGTGVAARIKERCHWVRVGSPPWVGGENDIDLGVWTEVCWDRDQGDGGGGGGDTGGEGGTGGGLHGISPGTRRPPSRPPPQPDPRPTTPCDKAKADLK
ncbi:MAG: hypothetical protein K8M05_13165 [Deltaproteobacteria bacterium]|nr:hypothetical protein [Kofleriaceae bacterium]